MNLNELKKKCQAVKAPAMPQDIHGPDPSSNGLIERLKAQEAREIVQLRKSRPLWILAAAVFLLAFLAMLWLPSSTVTPARLVFGGVLAAIYLVNATLLAKKLQRLTRIDYSESLLSFLNKAEERHRFMGPKERWFAGSGLILLGVVGSFYFDDSFLRRHVNPEHHALGSALFCLGYLLVCLLGFVFTYKNWKRDKASLWAETRRMKAELSAEEPGDSTIQSKDENQL